MVKIFLLGVERTNVRCDFHTDKGNWLVILRRADGSVDFDRNWNDYVGGFGDLKTEFWFGLDKLHRLTSSQTYKLRIDMKNFNGEKSFELMLYMNMHALYSAGNSRLPHLLKVQAAIGEYAGDVGDSFGRHDQKLFSTKIMIMGIIFW
uniref:ficolin-1-A-like n=1 Tax=Styela clava TaxID=7725 RepID=UPI00193AA401|nr:ficolin-1-A-like [Styela clava]